METVDVVVIGAGHNGLTAAAYLARAGLGTLVLEQAGSLGGMARTEEPVPGFVHHPHANYFSFGEVVPMARDFPAEWSGLRLTEPPAQHGIVFRDGRPPILIWSRTLDRRTTESVAVYSAADAATLAALLRGTDRITASVRHTMYGDASDAALARHAAEVTRAYGDITATEGLGQLSAAGLIDDLFVTPEVRTLMFALCVEFGTPLDEPGSALGLLGFGLWMLGRRRLPLGGMSTIPEALAAAARNAGATIRLGDPVRHIRCENGTAAGVETAAGHRVQARVVVSGGGLSDTLRELCPDVAGADAEAVSAYDATRVPSIASVFLALGEAPRFTSSQHDPAADTCWQTFVGFETPDEVRRHDLEVRAGLLPRARGALRVNSLWDPAQAPQGLHTAAIDRTFPDVALLSPDERQAIEDGYPDAICRALQDVAPNLGSENVLAARLTLPTRHDRTVSMRWGGSASPIPGLFLCGPSTFPGGGVHGACGYNAASAVLRALA